MSVADIAEGRSFRGHHLCSRPGFKLHSGVQQTKATQLEAVQGSVTEQRNRSEFREKVRVRKAGITVPFNLQPSRSCGHARLGAVNVIGEWREEGLVSQVVTRLSLTPSLTTITEPWNGKCDRGIKGEAH